MADPPAASADMLDAMQHVPLSANFSAADLCCAGETWERTRISNKPLESSSWVALSALCEEILEPVRTRFGQLQITYGFASPQLLRLIPAHAAPALDQHASCELNRRGEPICTRLGAAVDFQIAGVSSLETAIWISEALPFDRLYFYGADRPLHVSVGPERAGSIVAMLAGASGRRVPSRISVDWLRHQTT